MKRQEDGWTDRWKATTLTQDKVVLSQLSVPDLLVEGAAGVHVHVGHEAAVVEFLPNLTHS